MGILSDIVNGIASLVNPSDPVSCACCKNCKRIYRSGDYKRVFVCSHDYYVYDLGMPVLATKVEDIGRCYPPCELAEHTFDPYNPQNPSERNPEIIDYNDCVNDWDPNKKEQDSSVDANDYYQNY